MGLVVEATVTVMWTVPVPAGEVALMSPSSVTEKLVAGVVPNMTDVAPVKPEPVIATGVPPAAKPEVGLTPMIA
jgi:hypothetical protein